MGKEVETAPKLVTRHTIAEDYRKDVQILLAEDYPTNQEIALRHLHGAGYQVDLAEDGQRAVEACKRKGYDLILMDIQMPVMDGYEATKAIRDLEKSLATAHSSKGKDNDKWQMTSDGSVPTRAPIIAMTAHALKGDREKCLEAGMDDYIAKPLSRKKLLAMVENWVMPKAEGEKLRDSESAIQDPKSQMDEENDPMDFGRAIEEFEGDKGFLMEVVEGFLDNVRAQIGIIHQAIASGDAEVVRKEAHSIKGGAANLTADELSRIALELENIGKSGLLEGGTEVLERLERELHRLEVYARDR